MTVCEEGNIAPIGDVSRQFGLFLCKYLPKLSVSMTRVDQLVGRRARCSLLFNVEWRVALCLFFVGYFSGLRALWWLW
jgi:hypothetical protein